MSVLRLLREPRWLRGLAVAVLVALVCCALGRWQWLRREDRLAANAPLVQNYDDRPAEVSTVLPAGAGLDPDRVWTPVQVSGRYAPEATVLVRNRPLDDQFGYEVLVPLVLDDGTVLVVDRGWLPGGQGSAERPDTVPAVPDGEVTVVARLRSWEADRRGQVPAGQVTSIARDSVTRAVSGALPAARGAGDGPPTVLDAYAVLASETPAPALAPVRPARPAVDEGPHLAYTVQWFGFALTAFVVWVVAGRRELQARREGQSPVAPAASPGAVAGASGAAAGGPPPEAAVPAPAPRPARRRRREGADEAAEDAELDAGVDPARRG
ncbi:SURF1 family cytochrome oxidase biogenesis protein [Kineococcus sp. SYSU DK002]|uniref:SURF1 family cytochrome oxidase biogenesis protein n=1 Tax=Kineococcus sp. SYSU DK002 TaxID=3383123 RepID=UPI003D7EBCB4